MKRVYSFVTSLVATSFLLAACGKESGVLYHGVLGLGDTKIFVAGGVALSYAVTVYDVNGNLLEVLADYNQVADVPSGIAPFDAFGVVVSINGSDRLDKLNALYGGYSTFALSAQFTGNVYDVERVGSNYYVVEGNAIERFSSSGARFNEPSATAYITTPLGACALNTPRGLTTTSSGYLATVGTGNNNISIYNVSSGTAACVTNVALSNQPVDVTNHPNGYLYVTTLANDGIYRVNQNGTGATLIWNTATATYNPTAIAVHPDGNLLVGNQLNDSIEIFTTSGTFVGTFVRNSYTGDILDIEVIGGQ